jgi:hypothetical protein
LALSSTKKATEEQQAAKKRKIAQVSGQQSDLDIKCDEGCYYLVTTNEDHSSSYIWQFLLPENFYDKYAAFISNFKPNNQVSDYDPFSNKEIASFKDLKAIKDFFDQCELVFPSSPNGDYDEDAPFDNDFTFCNL